MTREEDGKIFVGGLSWQTTTDKLLQHFSKYGEIIEASVIKDKDTDQPRGFGFVKFKNQSAVGEALKNGPHILDGKQVDPKPCTPREVQIQKKEAEIEHVIRYKIFVGGLTKSMTEDEVRNFFEKFGPVAEVAFAISKEDGNNKGFGFVTFEKESSASEAVNIRFHDISGRRVEAKRAQPREKTKQGVRPKQSSGDGNNMPDPMAYPGWGPMPWGPPPNFGMAAGMMGPSGGYMPPETGYGTYGGIGTMGSNYAPGSNYGYPYAYNTQPMTGYPDMGKYNSQSTNYSSSKSSSGRSSGSGSGYHPYKR